MANYEVVIVVDAGCTDLAPVVRTRTYAGSFDGFRLDLSGSEFGADWNVMSLTLDGDGAYVNATDPPVWERSTQDTGYRSKDLVPFRPITDGDASFHAFLSIN